MQGDTTEAEVLASAARMIVHGKSSPGQTSVFLLPPLLHTPSCTQAAH